MTSAAAPPLRLCLVGATGLVGTSLITACLGRQDVRLIAVARREVSLPTGAKMEVLLAPVTGWDKAIATSKADVLVCALGTTMRQVKGDRPAYLAIDHDLVLECAKAAREAGIGHMIVVGSVGADRASNNFYLRTKGEVETQLRKLGFYRLDLLRPSLLVGKRRPIRPLEQLAVLLAPVMNLFLHGTARRYRAIKASRLAEAILGLCQERAAGKFVHEYDDLERAAKRPGNYGRAAPPRN
jgi:uncharacterized protein YbjT (DUF2867 family)